MPKNLGNVPKSELVIISADGERRFHAVPQVLKFGHVTVPGGIHYDFPQRHDLEFCFRLSSAEPVAEDELDGILSRTPFPHLFLKRPGVSHRYPVKSARQAQFLIYPESAMAEFSAAGIVFDPPGRPFHRNEEIDGLLAELRNFETCARENGNPDRIDLLAFRLITAVFLQCEGPQEKSESDRKIRQIASQLEAAPQEDYDMEDLARRNGFSRRSFFRNWNRIYPLSPTQFLIAKRMELAERLLQMGDLPVTRIAEQLHFSSTSYLIQEFRKHFGISPAAYRKKLRKQFR